MCRTVCVEVVRAAWHDPSMRSDVVRNAQIGERTAGVLAQHEFFRGLDADILRQLGGRAHLRSYAAGQTIFRKGDPGLGLLAVLSGIVRISAPSQDGGELVLNQIGPNQVFGEIALLDGGPRTADAVASAETLLLTLDRRDFLVLLERHPSIAVKLLAILCQRLRRTSEQVEDIQFAEPHLRLAKALLRIGALQGACEGTFRVEVTQQELGRNVGLSRESTNKVLKAWESDGRIVIEKGACTLRDLRFFQELAEEQALT
jgi:CRP/FNR family transcriptional regulator, cyclic AMP receptor protein